MIELDTEGELEPWGLLSGNEHGEVMQQLSETPKVETEAGNAVSGYVLPGPFRLSSVATMGQTTLTQPGMVRE